MRQGLRRLTWLQWVVIGMGLLLLLNSAAALVLNPDDPAPATLGRCMVLIGFPLLLWGTLPMYAGLPRPRSRRTDDSPQPDGSSGRAEPDVLAGRQWFSHIGLTLSLAGGALVWPHLPVGPGWLHRPFQIGTAVMLLLYWGSLLRLLIRRPGRRRTA